MTGTKTGGGTAPTAQLLVGGNNWVITINNVDKYDTAGNPYRYRFVEMNGNDIVSQNGVVNGFKVNYGELTGGAVYGEASGSGTLTQTIINTPANIKLDILKVKSNTYQSPQSTGDPLGGAVFTLEQLGSSGNATRTWTFSATDSSTGMTDMSDANIDPDIGDGIGDGTYRLREIQAPTGYNLNNVAITFKVIGGLITTENDGFVVPSGSSLVSASLDSTTHVPYFTDNSGVKTYHFVFENSTGAELPSTGEKFGLSRNGFGMAGLFLVGAFVAMYFYRRKRREDEFEL